MFSVANLAQAFTNLLALILCLTFHEAAHGYAAKFQGDDTPEREGRLTFNPIPHVDMIGTIILPLSAAIMQIPIILGWAKPVPINPNNFRNPQAGAAIVALAGPVSNLFLSAVCVVIIALHQRYLSEVFPPQHFLYPIIKLLIASVWINAVLAFFNLIPIAPLDGGALLQVLLPPQWAEFYEYNIAPYGGMFLLLLLATGSLGWISKFAMVYVGLVETVVIMFI